MFVNISNKLKNLQATSYKLQAKNKGFTLSESIIAITLILIGIVGIITLINKAAGFANIAASQMVAANLGQEGIEIVRNVRDTNWIGGKNWTKDLIGKCNNTFEADYKSELVCDSGMFLLFDDNIGYNYNDGQSTIYKRKIIITPISNAELRVQAVVSWSLKGASFENIVEDHLYNWY